MFKYFKKINWRFVPVVCLFLLLPLVVRLIHFNLDGPNALVYNQATSKDWFFYYKSVIFILLTVWMLVCLVFLRKKIKLQRDFYFNAYYLLGGIFILTSLLSAFFSDYRTCATVGAPTRFEGIGVIVCYIMVMFYTFFVFEELRPFKYILYSLMILIAIQLILGISQFVGYDLLNLRGLRELVSPGEVEQYYYFSSGSEPLFLRTAPGAWTGTLGNKNYSGSFVALLLPFFTVLACFIKARGWKLFTFLTTLAAIFIMFACQSQAGQVGVFCAFVVAFVILYKHFPTCYTRFKEGSLKTKLKTSFLALFMIVYIVFCMIVTGASHEINYMFRSIGTSLGFIEEIEDTALQTPDVLDFVFEPYRITFKTEDHALTVDVLDTALSFSDETGREVLATQTEDNTYFITEEAFYQFGFTLQQVETNLYVSFLVGPSPDNLSPKCVFRLDTTGNIELLNYANLQPIVPSNPPTFGFEGKERLGSSRGYIWSRTLPLVKDYMLLGAGPDAFIYVFPQDDFWGKWHHMSNPFIVVDKPHNTYLQLWINQGFIAFVAFVLINAIYLLHSLKLYGFKKHYTTYEGLGLAFMLATIGYLAASFFNDTTLSVTPLYFALLGCGMAYNRIFSNLQGPHQ